MLLKRRLRKLYISARNLRLTGHKGGKSMLLQCWQCNLHQQAKNNTDKIPSVFSGVMYCSYTPFQLCCRPSSQTFNEEKQNRVDITSRALLRSSFNSCTFFTLSSTFFICFFSVSLRLICNKTHFSERQRSSVLSRSHSTQHPSIILPEYTGLEHKEIVYFSHIYRDLSGFTDIFQT